MYVCVCVCVYVFIGIMLLEKQLLVNVNAATQPGPAKRPRGATNKTLPEGTAVWVELSRSGDGYLSICQSIILCLVVLQAVQVAG